MNTKVTWESLTHADIKLLVFSISKLAQPVQPQEGGQVQDCNDVLLLKLSEL